MVYFTACSRYRMLQHGWSPALVGVTTSHHWYDHCTGFQSVGKSRARSWSLCTAPVICWSCTRPTCLTDDCWLLLDVDRRRTIKYLLHWGVTIAGLQHAFQPLSIIKVAPTSLTDDWWLLLDVGKCTARLSSCDFGILVMPWTHTGYPSKRVSSSK